MKTLKSIVGYGILAIVLSACGGGGGGEDSIKQNLTNPPPDNTQNNNDSDNGGTGDGGGTTKPDDTDTGSDDQVNNAKPNLAPVISGAPIKQLSVGATYRFTPTATDANNDPLSFSITNKPSWANFNTQTGELSGVASVAGITKNVQISVTDGKFLVILTPFNLTVTGSQNDEPLDPGMPLDPTPINQPPVISGVPPVEVKVGSAYTFKPSASDSDGDSLQFAVTGIPSWLNFNTSTGELTGLPTANNQAGVISNVIISVSDGPSVIALPAFSIEVRANASPTIGGIPAAQVGVGQSYAFTPVVSDAEQDALTFSIANKPAWLAFNPSTGALTGQPSGANVGAYNNIQITVSDGYTSVALGSFSVAVAAAPVNQAPILSGTPVSVVREGQAYSFTPGVTDPEGDFLVYSIHNKPAWMSFNSATGAISGTPVTQNVGTYNGIEISVADGINTVTLSFSLTVKSTSARLSWAAPTTRSDGSALPLNELAGYRVYAGNNANNLSLLADLQGSGVTEHKVSNLTPATYYYAVTSYNVYGTESVFSAVVSKTIN